jgi:hypothetical protein
MNAEEMEREVERIVQTPIGEYQISLLDLWGSWKSDPKSTVADLVLLFSLRGRNEIQERERLKKETLRIQREQEQRDEMRGV